MFSANKANFGVKTDGTLWSWGNNEYGNLGDNSTIRRSSPTQIPGTTWKQVAGGEYSISAVKTDGTLWSWGYNVNGALGLNEVHPANYSSPVQVGSENDWDRTIAGQEGNFGVRKS